MEFDPNRFTRASLQRVAKSIFSMVDRVGNNEGAVRNAALAVQTIEDSRHIGEDLARRVAWRQAVHAQTIAQATIEVAAVVEADIPPAEPEPYIDLREPAVSAEIDLRERVTVS